MTAKWECMYYTLSKGKNQQTFAQTKEQIDFIGLHLEDEWFCD